MTDRDTMRARRAKHQAEQAAAELLLGDSLYLGNAAVFLSIAKTVERVIKNRLDPDEIEAAITDTTRTIVLAAALAVGRNVNRVREGASHD